MDADDAFAAGNARRVDRRLTKLEQCHKLCITPINKRKGLLSSAAATAKRQAGLQEAPGQGQDNFRREEVTCPASNSRRQSSSPDVPFTSFCKTQRPVAGAPAAVYDAAGAQLHPVGMQVPSPPTRTTKSLQESTFAAAQGLPGLLDPAGAPSVSALVANVCPVCNCSLAKMSDTEAGQAAHVNACLDAAAAGEQVQPTAASTAATVDRVQDSGDSGSNVANWLQDVGASRALDAFTEAEVDLSVLPHLSEYELQAMQLQAASLRQTILAAVQHQPAKDNSDGLEHYQVDQQQRSHAADDTDQQWPDDETGPHYMQHTRYDDCTDECVPQEDDGCAVQHNPSLAMASIWQFAAAAHMASALADGQYAADGCLPLQPVQCNQLHAATSSAASSSSNTSGSTRQPWGSAIGQRAWRGPQANPQQPSSSTVWLRQHPGQQACQDRHAAQQQQEQQQHTGQANSTLQDKQQASKQQWQALFRWPSRQQPAQQQSGRQKQQKLPAAYQPQGQGAAGKQVAQQVIAQNYNQQGRTADLPRWWPQWRRLPGTNILVDCFNQTSRGLGCNRSWILTHFHADHYMGLTKGFNQGHIFCTPVTAALVRLKLRVPDKVLVPVELGQEVMVEGTRLQFIDANHCPGAVMVLAHPPGGLPPVLHTGDARLIAAATQQQPALAALVGKAVLVLDTTYADPAYCFPPQQEVLDWTLRAVQAESFNPRCLFLFGSYTIGKERLFLHVAATLKQKVYVAAAKRSIMACLNLPPEQAWLLTTNHLEANIHVVPMRQVTLEAMQQLLVRYRGRYTAVVGFQPTGWTHGQAGGAGSVLGHASRSSNSIKRSNKLQSGTVVLYKVPYSEHSSCTELREFVAWFKPIDIIPSVNNDNKTKLRQMLDTVTSSGRITGPMDAFAQQQRA